MDLGFMQVDLELLSELFQNDFDRFRYIFAEMGAGDDSPTSTSLNENLAPVGGPRLR